MKKKGKQRLKILLGSLLISLSIGIILYFPLIKYGIQQIIGQIHIMYYSKPIDFYLNDPNYPANLKEKIHLIQEVKTFSVDSLGFNVSNSYNKLYHQNKNPLIWLLTAAHPFELKPKVWKFPILGTFSYKGFFNRNSLKKEEKKLRKEKYDTHIRPVNAWSTLGILNDPILSEWLKKDEEYLINTVLHELTHSTIFIKDKLQYNENLANFIADKGTEKFLTYKFGNNSKPLQQYIHNKTDRHIFSQYALDAAKKLEILYEKLKNTNSYSSKQEKKKKFIQNFMKNIDTLSFHNQTYYNYFKNFNPNNTFFLSYRRYRGKEEKFKTELENEFHKNLKAYVSYLKMKHPFIF